MWPHIVETVAHWPWSTIAAFGAAGAAISIAVAQRRERRQFLGRQTVVELAASSGGWHTEAAKFLGALRRHLQGTASASAVNIEAFDRLSAATSTTSQVFTGAKLACSDFELHLRIAESESKLVEFMERLQKPTELETPEHERERLMTTFEQSLVTLDGFGDATDALLSRGFAIYSQRRGLRYRRAKRRWDRRVKAVESANQAQ
jgi:hypothetical protein